MEQNKIFLEKLFEEIRSLSDTYDTDEADDDIFLLNASEVNAFSEDVLRIVKKFIKEDLFFEEEELVLDDDEDVDDLLFMDFYGEDDLD